MSDKKRVRSEAVENIDVAIKALVALRELTVKAEGDEWVRPKSADDHPEDPGIRMRGGHSDPTGDTAVDGLRLRLRRALRLNRSNAVLLRNGALGMHSDLVGAYRAYDGFEDFG